ncbi:hypothetical protein [Flavobacterium sp. 14A]|uniref:hypothetical protein n=1 Tax=Flavobacterium sp. 14A TaxID=2735896 RepID=UPI0015709F57|nr:hypothetical protein [Flavobacterium sp. 14A]NRT11529.1 hypothetical protein [Flavobacterium sp. 14A]
MKHYKNIHLGETSIALTGFGKSVTPEPIKVQIDPSNEESTAEIVQWGSDNLYPQNFYNKKFLRNGAAVGGINTLASTTYGNGFSLYKKIKSEAGKVELVEELLEDYPDIADFVENNNLDKYWIAKIADLSLFQIAFTEWVVSANGEKLTKVVRQQAAHCRFEIMNAAGDIPRVIINTDWATANPKYNIPIAYFDKDRLTAQDIKSLCKEKGIYNFCTKSNYAYTDENYYPKTHWHAVDRNGWMDVANSVPEFKQAFFENQVNMKFIVYVSDYYFENFYKEEWDDFDANKRQEMREQLSAAIDGHLSGNKAAGRSIISPIFEEGGKFVKGIEVTPIDDKLKDGAYNVDASAANSEILFAIGVNPAIIGAGTPGGSNLGGSGSNIREAYTVLSASLVPKRVYVSDDWNFLRSFNGWDRSLIGMFSGVNLTTLDKNPSGQENIIHQ